MLTLDRAQSRKRARYLVCKSLARSYSERQKSSRTNREHAQDKRARRAADAIGLWLKQGYAMERDPNVYGVWSHQTCE